MKWWLWAGLFLLLAAVLGGDQMTSLSIQEVKKRHEARLMALPGVVSVGIGLDKDRNPAVIVGLDGPRPETQAQLPHSLEGYPLVIQVLGPIKAQ